MSTVYKDLPYNSKGVCKLGVGNGYVVNIGQNFVAFSEYMNFKRIPLLLHEKIGMLLTFSVLPTYLVLST